MYKQAPARLFLRMGAIVLSMTLAGAARAQNPASGQSTPAETAPSGAQASATAATRPADKRMTLSPPALRPLSLGSVTVSGSLRMRAEAWDWFAGEAENTYGFFHSILRVRVGQQKTGWGWQIELAQPSVLGAPDNAIAAGGQGALGPGGSYYSANGNRRNAWGLFPSKAFVTVKGFGGKDANNLRLGRFEFLDGAEVTPQDPTLAALKPMRIAQRLIGNFAFSVTGRSEDGFSLSVNPKKVNVTVAAARPTRGVYQVNGWGSLDVGFVYGALTAAVNRKSSSGELRIFGLGYYDARAVAKTDNRPAAVRNGLDRWEHIQIGTYGAHYMHVFNTRRAGKWDVFFWGAGQTGSWGLQNHRAWAVATEVGWQPEEARLRPWLRLGYSYGSGDDNPNDKLHGTFFQVLPTPRWYARFPFYNMENNANLAGILILRPSPKLSLRSETHALRLASARDLWYQGGGAYQPHTFGYTGRSGYGNRGLGNYWDLGMDYAINPHWATCLYFGKVWGKGVMQSLYPKNPNAMFGYSELTLKF